jgi:thiol-disulfide isomerase/thioredoxin
MDKEKNETHKAHKAKHAPNHKHAVHEKKNIQISKLGIWKISTIVLAVLLVLSIFTNFSRPNVKIDIVQDMILSGDIYYNSQTGKVEVKEVITRVKDNDETPTSSSDKLSLTIINDKRCSDCMFYGQSILSQLRNIFPTIEVTELDYSNNDGKQLYDRLNVVELPAFLFNDAVENDPAYSNVAQFLSAKGDYLLLNVGASFNPTKEICDNGVDDTGNGLIDCDDPDCANTLICNPNMFSDCVVEEGLTPETIIFYYSLSCPYCTMMIPGVEQLEEEGYSFKWVEGGNAQDEVIVNKCFRQYMDGGVPQFICPKTSEIRPGAFMDRNTGGLDLDAFRAWVDSCVA